jgi:hypothetical protein
MFISCPCSCSSYCNIHVHFHVHGQAQDASSCSTTCFVIFRFSRPKRSTVSNEVTVKLCTPPWTPIYHLDIGNINSPKYTFVHSLTMTDRACNFAYGCSLHTARLRTPITKGSVTLGVFKTTDDMRRIDLMADVWRMAGLVLVHLWRTMCGEWGLTSHQQPGLSRLQSCKLSWFRIRIDAR